MTSAKSITTRLHESDNTVVVHADIQAGSEISQEETIALDSIPFGHKIATAFIKKGDVVKKYGQIIGFASRDIQAGEHVHTHNVKVKAFDRDYAIGADAGAETEYETKPATFEGIKRVDGPWRLEIISVLFPPSSKGYDSIRHRSAIDTIAWSKK